MLWGLLTSFCCLCTGGLVLAVPGSAVACYACGYRQTLRAKYNLLEAPCGDLTTHLFCHLCAICQEYREIRERTDSSSSSGPSVTPPPIQTMDEPWLEQMIYTYPVWQLFDHLCCIHTVLLRAQVCRTVVKLICNAKRCTLFSTAVTCNIIFLYIYFGGWDWKGKQKKWFPISSGKMFCCIIA